MNKTNEDYSLTREWIADSLANSMTELVTLVNETNIDQVKKQIDTLRLLIAEIYPERYEHYLYENYAFGFPDYELDLNKEITSDDI